MLYTPWLTTLDYVRRDRRMGTSVPTIDDALIKQFIAERSQEFQETINRTCLPYVDSKAHDWQGYYGLKFDDDLLELTTITNGDSTSVSTSAVWLEKANVYPKWRMVVKQSAGVMLTYNNLDYRQAITIAGVYGYVPNYLSCWPTSGVSVPSGGLASGATSLALTGGQGALFEVGQYLKMDSEVIQVTAIVVDTLTLSRAELGTTTATHTAGTVIYKFRLLPDIQGAVTEMVCYSYKTKDQLGARVQVFANGVLQVQDMDRRVQAAVDKHTRRTLEVID